MSDGISEQTQHSILAVLPNRGNDLARLLELANAREPVVTVVGKYNHGKSRLLNELLGADVFAVADKRETASLFEYVHRGIRWLDAPGLDADVRNEDDRHALLAAWLKSDIRLFVHAAKEGEFDAKELALLDKLRTDGARTQRQTLVVLSQVDQLADEDGVTNVMSALTGQVPGIAMHAVSATRHRKGAEAAKRLLVERSGIPPLLNLLDDALAKVPLARAHETKLLFSEIREELNELRVQRMQTLESLQGSQARQRQLFDQGLNAVLEKVGHDVEQAITAAVPDYAVVPDTSEDKYRITAAKLERARIQIAYSHACIRIDSFLAGQGVVSLPKDQQTAVGSLNTVMVAVMGVSVKFRKNLSKIFCEAAGRGRMQREFAHYFELSSDRQRLRAEIVDAERAVAATERASAALRVMQDDT